MSLLRTSMHSRSFSSREVRRTRKGMDVWVTCRAPPPRHCQVERVQLPDLEPFTVEKWEMEDDVDDVVAPQVQPPVLNAGPAGTGLSDAQTAISDGLHQRLFFY